VTVKELIGILEQYKDAKDAHGQEVSVFIRDSSGDLNSLWEDNITIDSDGDLILNVRW